MRLPKQLYFKLGITRHHSAEAERSAAAKPRVGIPGTPANLLGWALAKHRDNAPGPAHRLPDTPSGTIPRGKIRVVVMSQPAQPHGGPAGVQSRRSCSRPTSRTLPGAPPRPWKPRSRNAPAQQAWRSGWRPRAVRRNGPHRIFRPVVRPRGRTWAGRRNAERSVRLAFRPELRAP